MTAPTVGTNRSLGVANATSESKFLTMNYTSSLVTQKFFVAPIKLLVTAIQGVPRVAGSGGACTLSFYKASDGVAVGSGTLLHTGSYDMTGTADTNQYLTLSTNRQDLRLDPGDSIGYVLTGTATSAVGNITVTVEPVV